MGAGVAETAGTPAKRAIRHNHESPWNASIEGRTAVYRLYDTAHQLLYVGISMKPERRWYEHSLEKMWWHLVAEKEVTWHDSREQALTVEEEVERIEKPRFGDTHRLGAGWRSNERRTDSALQAQASELVRSLGARIATGEYPAGSKMPTARKIAEAQEVSITMARSALSELAEPGGPLCRGIGGLFVRTEEGVR